MEGVESMTHTAAKHQDAIEMFEPHFRGAVMPLISFSLLNSDTCDH